MSLAAKLRERSFANTQNDTVTVTTDASGDATVYSSHLTGWVATIDYVKTDFANGVDFTITRERSGQDVWVESNVNASATKSPTQPTHSQVGVATGDLTGIFLAHDRLKFVLAQGGDTKTGTFYVTVV